MASWIDGVVGGIARGVDSAKEGSKIFVEKAKLNTQIQDAEREKNQLLMNMGTLIYNLHKSGEIKIDQCSDICESINQLNMQISALQEQIKSLNIPKQQYYGQPVQPIIENGVRCQCGFVNKQAAKFYAHCGQPLG